MYLPTPVNEGIVINGDFKQWSEIPKFANEKTIQDPNIQIVNYTVDDSHNKISFYLEVKGKILAGEPGGNLTDSVNIFIDSDRNSSTGYKITGIGADYMISIYGRNGTVEHSCLYHYYNETGLNWNSWVYVMDVKTSVKDGKLETQVYPNNIGLYRNLDNANVLIYTQDYLGNEDFSDAIINTKYPSLLVYENVTDNKKTILSPLLNNYTKLMSINLNTYTSNLTVNKIVFRLETGIMLDKLGDFRAVSKSGITFIGTAKGDYVALSGHLSLDKRSNDTLTVFANLESLTSSDNSKLFALSLVSVETSEHAVLTIKGDLENFRKYISVAPNQITIDGAFGDWTNPINVPIKTTDNSNIDITNYDVKIQGSEAMFYLRVDGTVMGGKDVPVNPVSMPNLPPTRPPVPDSDRDTMNDSVDPYPHDFNNDGVNDSSTWGVHNSVNGPDVDGDGITDYPYGPDMWLNTTIPGHLPFPVAYWNKNVSLYIGPSNQIGPRLPIVTGEDYAYIFIDSDNNSNTGYYLGNMGSPMGADYLVNVTGKDNSPTSVEFEKFVGTSQDDWNWTVLGDTPQIGWDTRQIETGINTTNLNFANNIRVFFMTSDWKGNSRSTDGAAYTALGSSYDQKVLKSGVIVGDVSSDQKVQLSVVFKIQNEKQLDQYLSDVQNPKSSVFHHFLTTDNFKQMYSPEATIYDDTAAYLQSQGLNVTKYPTRLMIGIDDYASKIANVFKVQFKMFRSDNPSYKSTYFSATGPLSLPSSIAPYIQAIDGTTNANKFHLNIEKPQFANFTAGEGLFQQITGADLQVAYQVQQLYNDSATAASSASHSFSNYLKIATILWEGTTTQNGHTQVGPYNPTDVTYYYSHVMPAWERSQGGMPTLIPHGTAGTVAPGSVVNDYYGVYVENVLDLEMTGLLAPGANISCVYGPGYQGGPSEANFPDNEYAYAATLTNLAAVSNSWGGGDSLSDAATEGYVKQMEATGTSVLASSGDDGDTSTMSNPANDGQATYGFTAVGGTTMLLRGTVSTIVGGYFVGGSLNMANPILYQDVWYDYAAATMSNGDHWGTQSGTSTAYPEPIWQKGTTGSGTGRDICDVAALGNNTACYMWGGASSGYYSIAGTSVACPVWAGIITTMDAFLSQKLGYLNPLIYQIGANNTKYDNRPFYDVINTPWRYHNHQSAYDAKLGWDYATGWGTPNAWNFVMALKFWLNPSPRTVTVTAGGSGPTTISAWYPTLFNSTVKLNITTTLPSGVTALWSNGGIANPLPSNKSAGTSVLTLSTLVTTLPGTYPLTILGTNRNSTTHLLGNLTNTTTVILVVNPLLTHFYISPISTPQTAGSPFSITVTAKDMYNITVTAFVGTVGLSDTTGTINPTVSGGFTLGVWTGSVTIAKAQTGVTITATNSGNTGTSNPFDVVAGSLNSFYFNNIPSPQTAGNPFSITITAKDAYNNTIASFVLTAALSDTTVTISPTVTGNFVSGVWTGTVTITKAQAGVTITATGGGKAGTSNPFTVIAGVLNHFYFNNIPSPQTATVAFSITITAKDTWNNTVTTFVNTATLADNTGTISPTVTGNFVSGVWTGTVTITKVQTGVHITATYLSVTGQSNDFNVIPKVPEFSPAPLIILSFLIFTVIIVRLRKRSHT